MTGGETVLTCAGVIPVAMRCIEPESDNSGFTPKAPPE